MTTPASDDGWPDYLPGPRDDLLALGVVSLNYGYLENIFRALFGSVTEFTEAQVTALFERINNDARQAIFDQMLDSQPFPPELTVLIRHFIDGFAICAANRHSIMHAHHGGIHEGARGTGGIVLQKYSRSGARFVFFAHVSSLRAIADAIDRQAQFGVEVMLAVATFRICQNENRLHDFERRSLPSKSPLPATLDWLPLKDPQIGPPPPGSSRP